MEYTFDAIHMNMKVYTYADNSYTHIYLEILTQIKPEHTAQNLK